MSLDESAPPRSQPPPRPLALAAAVLLAILATGWLDVATGPDLGMSLFYLLPISAAAWWGGSRVATAAAVVASAIWVAADVAARSTPQLSVSIWNGSTRLLIFVAMGMLLARVRRDQRTLQVLLDRERKLARSDGLTGLANLRAFQLALETEMARAKRAGHPLCLMYLDVDNFKRVNDRYGHAKGDEALIHIADTIRTSVRATDVVARLGGDEFAVLMWQVEHAVVTKLAQRIVDAVTEIAEDYPGSELGMSAGAAYFEEAPDSAEIALRIADRTMYRAKRLGKGQVCVTHHRVDDDSERVSVEPSARA